MPVEMILPYLTVWGAVLSTGLAFLKVFEIYKDRMRLVVTYNFDSREHEGNDVIIYNPSKTPIMINYYELDFYQKTRFGYRKLTGGRSPDDGELVNINIPANSRFVLNFKDAEYFDWGKQKIMLRLHVIGRRPITKIVYLPE